VDIRRWLREDRHTPYAERLRRDRDIGLSLASAARSAGGGWSSTRLLLSWWARISADVDADQRSSLGTRVVGLRRLATALLGVVGIAMGSGLAGLAFGYQGDYPVNLVALLGVLVGMPVLMLVVTVILLIGHIPGMSALREVFSAVNPGRWAGAVLDRLAGVELFAAFVGNRPASAFARWQLVVFSQWLAVGFFIGVLGTAWLLIAFTDLAFGWSTTLRIEAAEVYGWFSALAAPWAAWLPAAAPDSALVEASRFYRLEEGGMAAARVARLGQWWPFVLMTITVYGLLPRVVLLGFAGWRLRAATRSLLSDDPEVTALVDRLSTPRARYESDAQADAIEPADSVPPPRSLPMDDGTRVIVWNDAATAARVAAWLGEHFGIAAQQPLALGILQDAGQQRRVLQGLGGGVRRFVIFTKGWEPPLLEFADFLKLLRDQAGADASLTVVPIDVTGTRVSKDEREIWARALAREHDPHLYVVEADVDGERQP